MCLDASICKQSIHLPFCVDTSFQLRNVFEPHFIWSFLITVNMTWRPRTNWWALMSLLMLSETVVQQHRSVMWKKNASNQMFQFSSLQYKEKILVKLLPHCVSCCPAAAKQPKDQRPSDSQWCQAPLQERSWIFLSWRMRRPSMYGRSSNETLIWGRKRKTGLGKIDMTVIPFMLFSLFLFLVFFLIHLSLLLLFSDGRHVLGSIDL